MHTAKVCHMTSAHPPEDIRIFQKECISLANAGYEVFLVERGENYDKNGVHIIGVGDLPKARWKRMTEGTRRVYEKALALDCDIYHFHDPELLPYGLKLKKMGKKVIFDIHENTAKVIQNKQYIPLVLRRVFSRMYSAYEAAVCRRLDGLITVTPTQTRAFQTKNGNTVEVANFPVIVDQCHRGEHTRKALAFAGAIGPQWNHHLIIRALNELQDVEYVLCGSKNEYVKNLTTLSGWDKVDYKGIIPHEQVNKLLATCMVGVALLQPSGNTAGKIGTMGNTKIFEEMMAGLPVVCTDFDLWREFIDEYQCGIYVDVTDEEAVIAAFQYLFEHPEEARRMGQNGIRAVREKFNWDNEAKKLLSMYSTILNS